MRELADRTEVLEFTVASHAEARDVLLERRPRIIGIGVYIWNVEAATRLAADLKRALPETILVLGGPEVSYETDEQPIVGWADYVIAGEADLTFPALCRELLAG